jgi:two-component system sensor histidine kinase/response regulator
MSFDQQAGKISQLPTIPEHILTNWQSIVDTMAELVSAPIGLIRQLTESGIQVIVVSTTENNPYHSDDSNYGPESGLLCETVLKNRRALEVQDICAETNWSGNPDVERGIISYLGYPIFWPDGNPFGTICVLDTAPHSYPPSHKQLVDHFRDLIEQHIASIYKDQQHTPAVVDTGIQSQEALRLSEERFKLLIEHAADDFFLHDVNGCFLDVNERACQSTGYTREELLQMKVTDISIDIPAEEKAKIWKNTQPGFTASLLSIHRRKDGSSFPVEVRITCYLYQGQKLFLGMVRDITERVEAERAIHKLNAELEERVNERTIQWRKSVDLLQSVMDGATDAIFVKDLEGRFLLFNRAASEFAGIPENEVIGNTAKDIFGEVAAKRIRDYELEVIRSGEPITVEETLISQGSPRIFLATRSPYRDEAGNIIGLIGISRDITEKREAEEALRNSEARWQFAVDGAGDGIWDWDVPTNKVFYSPQWKAMLGYSDDEVGDTTDAWSRLIHPEDLERCWETIDEHFKGDAPVFILEHRMKAKDGSWRWILDRGKVVERAEDGTPLRVIGSHSDITTRKHEEEELRIHRERLMLAAEISGLGVWDFNIDTNSLYCDDQWYNILGLDSNLVSITSIDDFKTYIHPDDIEKATDIHLPNLSELLATHQNYRNVFRIIRPDGEIRWLRSAAYLAESASGLASRAVGVIMDITESHLAEAKIRESYAMLKQAEKLAKIGSWKLDLLTGTFTTSEVLFEMNGADPSGPPLTPEDLQRLLDPESYKKVDAAIGNCIATGEPYTVDVTHFRPDGTSFAAQIRGQAQRNEKGEIVSISGTVQDMSEVREAQIRLATLADNLPSGAIYRVEHKPTGTPNMLYMSAGILSLIGVPADEIMEDIHVLLNMIHEDDAAEYHATVEKALESRDTYECIFRVKSRTGQLLWMQSRAAVSSVRPDGTTIWDGIIRDITKEQHAAEALSAAKETAEKAEQAKSEFLATMSHEIRTPMNTVIGMTRLTLQTELAPKQRNYLKKIDASAKTLLSIINDILDFSKIEAGRLELEDTEFTLESLLETVSAATAMRAEEKGLEIAYSIPSSVPRNLRGDPLRLGQVLINLVGNAVKFTEHGEVIIAINTIPDAPTLLSFSVQDTGIGLDADQIEGLFQPFTQAAPQTSRRYGGTGLGLTISKHLIESMGGEIAVESNPGKGSNFHFTVAVCQPEEITPHSSKYHPMQQFSGRRVLVVDDNASSRQILADIVTGFGMKANAVDSGPMALAALRSASRNERPFDLVLMDWRMPTMDGLETARLIREDESLCWVPAVLMVTAYAREEVVQGVEHLDLQGLLIKPVTESVLFNILLDILVNAESDSSLKDSQRNYPIPRELIPGKKTSLLTGQRALVVDDNALNREVACDFLLAVNMVVDTAVDGFDALNKIHHNEYDVVLMDMHMPDMDGLTATREIRKDNRWNSLPIVALTAQARVEDRAASLDAGMTAYLTKPIDEAALYETLISVLTLSSTSEPIIESETMEVEETNTTIFSTEKDLGDFDLVTATKRLRNDPARVQRLLLGFIRDFSDAPQKMNSYLQSNDLTQIAALAHMLKGAASYFDAHKFCKIAENLEMAARNKNSEPVQTLGPVFVSELKSALEKISNWLKKSETDNSSVIKTDFLTLLSQIEQAEPLVLNGDYAAQPILDEICTMVQGTSLEQPAESTRTHYEDLELEQANLALIQLKHELLLMIDGESD